MRKVDKTYTASMIEIAEDWRIEHGVEEIDIDLAADWAVDTDRYQREPISRKQQCRQDLLRALQRQKYDDPQGRSVRTHHNVKLEWQGEQLSLFVDVRIAKPNVMQQVFAQNFDRIKSDVRRHSVEKQSYDDNNPYGVQLLPFDYDMNPVADEARLSGVYDDSYEDDDDDS